MRALRHALDHDRLHHAYLFTGTRGVGKTTIARLLAKCLNCERGVSSTPCGECSICQEVASNRFVDLIEVDAASRTGVADTRELLENAQYLPTRGRYKVYLIDEVHMLSGAAFNALLKTLEEPPEHVKFLLATTDPKKVPITVLSRCLQFQLRNLSAERIAEYLAGVLDEEGVGYEPAALAVIAQAARGSMRDALSITDQAIAYGQGTLQASDVNSMLGLVGRDELNGLLDAIASRSAGRILEVTAELAERGANFDDLLAELMAALHRMAVDQALARDAVEGSGSDRSAFAPEETQLFYQIALMGYRDLQIAPDPRTGLEMTLLRMLAFAPDEDTATRVPRSDRPATATDASARAGTGAHTTSSLPSPTAVAGRAGMAPGAATRREAASRDEAEVRGEIEAGAGAEFDAAAQADIGAAGQLEADDGVVAGADAPWHQIVAELSLAGVARMIAEHAVLLTVEGGSYRLLLDNAHDTLLSDAQVANIERALAARNGAPVRVQVQVGRPPRETPAQRAVRVRAERQRAAEQTLAADGTVQSLLSEFGGRIDGVRPVEQLTVRNDTAP
ncbi:MAG: DNA polymerase III subunit gamma/tau [Pseudomonadales bacterium]